MEFDEVAEDAATKLEQLRTWQRHLEDELVPIMTGLVQCTSLMSSPKAAGKPRAALDTTTI
jgi:2-methylisocitrate lyase-like PEP mutase family enzyme